MQLFIYKFSDNIKSTGFKCVNYVIPMPPLVKMGSTYHQFNFSSENEKLDIEKLDSVFLFSCCCSSLEKNGEEDH